MYQKKNHKMVLVGLQIPGHFKLLIFNVTSMHKLLESEKTTAHFLNVTFLLPVLLFPEMENGFDILPELAHSFMFLARCFQIFLFLLSLDQCIRK